MKKSKHKKYVTVKGLKGKAKRDTEHLLNYYLEKSPHVVERIKERTRRVVLGIDPLSAYLEFK